jgi:para-aminobenzoate synthetase/4-amino-4-deoxychorismate lyase
MMDGTARWTVRFDDRSPGGSSFELAHQSDAGVAHEIRGVIDELARAEREARSGRWVAVAVAYEAAAAFETATTGRAFLPGRHPLVAWASFAARHPAGPPAAGDPAAGSVVTRHPATGYATAAEAVRTRIALGHVYQVNVADRFRQHDARPDHVYARLLRSQSAAFGALIQTPSWSVACASPELFFRWDDDTITTRPMKGTRARHPRPDVDAARARELAASTKDRAENVMIVDLIRNDLSRVATLGSVRVPELFAIERYETVWQMTSTVQAEADSATALVDVFRALFPCGSVTGAPKIAAMRIIDELESERRGFYCGAVGYLSPPGAGPRAVFCVPIRTATISAGGDLVYGAGAGITWPSDPNEEDAEVATKAKVLTDPWPVFSLLETLRLDTDGLLHVHEHVDRMIQSAAWFGIDVARPALAGALDRLSPVTEPHRVRLLLDRDGTVRVECTPLDAAPDVVRLAIDTAVTRSDDVFSCHKTTARAHYAAALSRHPAADEVVLVNERGNAIETTTANLAYRIGDAWFVPPLADGGLAGIGRQLGLADGRVRERSIAATELRDCGALAVISDLRGWRRAVLSPS